MKKISSIELQYPNIFISSELKYVYDFYKKYKNLFNLDYQPLTWYTDNSKRYVDHLFIGGFLSINEDDIVDTTQIYIFLEVNSRKFFENENYKANIFFSNMYTHKKYFVLNKGFFTPINKLNSIIANDSFKIDLKNKIIESIQINSRYEKEILETYL